MNRLDAEALEVEALARYGPQFTADFAAEECHPRHRVWESSHSDRAPTALRLVELHRLPVADLGPEVLRDWVTLTDSCVNAVYAEEARQERIAKGDPDPAAQRHVPEEWVAAAEYQRGLLTYLTGRTEAYLEAVFAADLGMDLSGFVRWAVREGRTSRETVLPWVIAALDSAARPGERLAWVRLLIGTAPGELAITDVELVAAADRLAGVVSLGEGQVVEALVPRLIASAAEPDLPDVAIPGLMARTKKAQRAVLAALAARPRPEPNIAQEVASAVEQLAVGTEAVATAAVKLLAAWGLDAPAAQESAATARGRWQPTPPVWTPPQLRHEPAAAHRIVELAGVLKARQWFGADVVAERFLAEVVELAHADPDAARQSLKGFVAADHAELSDLADWATGRRSEREVSRGSANMVRARGQAVIRSLGSVPALLSTPSTVDLSVSAADLLARLERYQRAGLSAEPSDVTMALTRLDPATVGPAERAALEASPVCVEAGALASKRRLLPWFGGRKQQRVGTLVLRYLADPAVEPALASRGGNERLWPGAVAIPDSLKDFPHAVPGGSYGEDALLGMLFPRWGDAVSAAPSMSNVWLMGPLWEQLVLRGTPLSPGTASNLVALARSAPGTRAADMSRLLDDAWSRGLLRPGAFDLGLIDWMPHGRASLASLARVLLDASEAGAAAYAWGFLDALLLDSAGAARLFPGTAQLADALADLTPDAVEAVTAGIAGAEVFLVPGLRAVAARGGTSASVRAARAALDAVDAAGGGLARG